jgi:prophage regulatory protein
MQSIQQHIQAERHFRRPDVEKITGLSRAAIYAKMADGSLPRPVRIGKRAVDWRERQITAWMDRLEETGRR